MSRRRNLLALGAAFAVALASATACEDAASEHACTDIPAGGCPLSRGVACEDPSCIAVYACQAGNAWVLDHTCAAHDAAAPVDAAALPDAAPVVDAAADGPPGANGGPGCGPLQAPDCALGFALACPAGCCDCEDLFVCQNGSWTTWGTCSADGGVRQHP